MKVTYRIKEILEERSISQKELSIMTGIRESTISDICRGNRSVVNIMHLAKIAKALDITDMNVLIKLEVEENAR